MSSRVGRIQVRRVALRDVPGRQPVAEIRPGRTGFVSGCYIGREDTE